MIGRIEFGCRQLYALLTEDDTTEVRQHTLDASVTGDWLGGIMSPNNSFAMSEGGLSPQDIQLPMDRAMTPSGYVVPEREVTAGYCHPGRLLSLLSPRLEEGTVVCVDVGDVTIWTSLCLCLDKPQQRMLASMRLGTMGYSLCAAMAAASLRPDRRVVAVAGDGGIQMSINELATLRQLGVKQLLVIVLVNQVLGRVAHETWGPVGGPPPSGCEILNPDFVKLAQAYGGQGERVATADPNKVEEVLERALAHQGLFILEVVQDPDVKPLMAKHIDRQASVKKPTSLPTSMTHALTSVESVDELLPEIKLSRTEVHSGIFYKPQAKPKYSVTFHGHVDFVIKGTVPRELLDEHAPLAGDSMRYAFEAGTVIVDDIYSIGEMCAVKGKIYTKCTNESRDDYYKLVMGNSMVSPAAAIVGPLDAVPAYVCELDATSAKNRPLSGLLVSMLRKLQNQPFCAGGKVHFGHLRATAVCKPTVFNEDIFSHTEQYYAQGSVDLNDRAGFIFGFVADFNNLPEGTPAADLRRVLYPGSSGESGSGATRVCIHFHIVILKKEFAHVSYAELQPEMFDDIEHLDCNSLVHAMKLEVFPIAQMQPHVPTISDVLPPFSHLNPDGSWGMKSVIAVDPHKLVATVVTDSAI